MSPDVSSHFSSTGSGMPAQNGSFQSVAGSSLHSNVSIENNQMQHHQYSSQTQAIPTTGQHFQQQHQTYQTYQQQQVIQPQQPHLVRAHQQQQSSQQLMQQQLQQRNLNTQQQRYQKQAQSQPKQILQHSPSTQGKTISGPVPSILPVSAENTTQQSTNPQPSQSAVMNGQVGGENKLKTPNTSDNTEDEKNEENDSASNASETQSLANTKEKTPMCLINELARFNKMHHQYTLVDEQGPAHKKTFYVKLKLGEEEYSASGESIKKAQHAAAAIALVATKYQHPPPKPTRQLGDNAQDKEGLLDGTITPTVELNALAMKRGEAAIYKSIEPQQPPYYHQPNMDFRGMYNQRYHQYHRVGRDPRYRGSGIMFPLRYYPRMSRAFYVSLRVGHREFIGDGPTRQAARHNAAQKALRVLKNLPVQGGEKKIDEEEEEVEDDSLKSEISLVHEIALRRNMVVHFEVIRETGPPHMKNFVTRCTVSDIKTEGEGNSKKTSKKKAAELMLEELRKLPPVPTPTYQKPKAKIQMNKKKNRNLIKSELQQHKADPNYGVGINPISRLIQIMQAQKKKEPVYTLVTERGMPRRREFVVQVEVEEKTCTGSGPNKKLAKRSAAEAMLQLLGYTKPSPQPTKSSIKNSSGEGGQTNGDKKVTFVEGDSPGGGVDKSSTGTHQRVPGLLHLPSKTSSALTASCNNHQSAPIKESSHVDLSSILKPNLRPEIQLKELCKAMDCLCEIDDFTKKLPDGTEHITRITIGRDNPQAFHGSNTTLESSRDMAALDALKVLVARAKDLHPGGDGPQMKKEILARPGSGGKKDFSK